MCSKGHLQIRSVDIADTRAVVAALDGADVVWIETPTNPTLDVADVAAICAAAAARGVRVVVDSTFATPICAQPLGDGATIVIHSGTKFIGGHSDLLIGLAVTTDDAIYDRLHQTRLVNGSTPGALEAFLALRGVRTLPLRMERAQANAVELVARLRAHEAVANVRYPGFGAMVAFELKGGASAADAACRAVRVDRASHKSWRGRDDDGAPTEVRGRCTRAAGLDPSQRRHRAHRRHLGRSFGRTRYLVHGRQYELVPPRPAR